MITKRDRMNLLEQEINTMFDNIDYDSITEKECEPILEILGQLREEVQKVLLIHDQDDPSPEAVATTRKKLEKTPVSASGFCG